MNAEQFGWSFLRKKLDDFGEVIADKNNDLEQTWSQRKFQITDGVNREVMKLMMFGGGATGSSSVISASDMDFIAEVKIHSTNQENISHEDGTKRAEVVGAREDMVNTDQDTRRAILHLDSNTEVSLLTNDVSLKYQSGWINTT